jgi:hypothetical protein
MQPQYLQEPSSFFAFELKLQAALSVQPSFLQEMLEKIISNTSTEEAKRLK